ncbi:TPA: hypothetical protein NIU59_001940 [Klebsiella michiganensis]|nr:hypothetical protein [Klebsiella michiganensis]
MYRSGLHPLNPCRQPLTHRRAGDPVQPGIADLTVEELAIVLEALWTKAMLEGRRYNFGGRVEF